MVDPVGAAIGAASLAVQLLDGAVKGFTFFLAVGNMKKSCLHLRTRLEIEQRRILNFAEAAGILNFESEKNVPLILQKEQLVLVAVFTQIDSKLADLATFTERYQEFQYKQLESSTITVDQLDVKERYASLVTWEKAAEKRAEIRAKAKKHIQGTNHLIKYYNIGTNIVKNPKSLRWTAFDEKAFQTVLADLAGYNDFLEGLLHDEYAKRLDERTRKTWLEVVLVRDEVEDIKRLLLHAILPGRYADETYNANNKHLAPKHPLAVLAGTKLRSVLNDISDEHKPPAYHEVIKSAKVHFDQLEEISEIPSDTNAQMHRRRATAKLKPGVEGEVSKQVFIEWKTYALDLSKTDKAGKEEAEMHQGKESECIPKQSNVDRINGLVSLLQNSRLEPFRVPISAGYVDIREDDSPKGHPPLFGLLYEIPFQSQKITMPVTLLQMLESRPRPSLGARMKLAYAISDSVLYFNSVRWFHKSLRPDAVIFHPDADGGVDITQPYLAGFEYSRPDSKGATTTHPSQHPLNELYVHPDYQGSLAGPGYARSFDVYALGIILLEIAYWEPVRSILSTEFTEDENGRVVEEPLAVRPILLQKRKSKRPYLTGLKGIVGDRYHAAVEGCIRGFVGDEEDENEVEVSIRLHEGFVKDVIGNLGSLLDL